MSTDHRRRGALAPPLARPIGDDAHEGRAAPTLEPPDAPPALRARSAGDSDHATAVPMRVGALKAAELPWFAAVALATLALVEVPHLVAYGQEARGFTFMGMLWWSYDFAQYAAA